jgi:Xaa-Pro aminopeptidase
MGTGIAVLRSAEQRSIEGDYPQDSDYREKNDFFYLTGIEEPGAYLVLVADSTNSTALYLPPRDSSKEQWTGVRLGAGDEARRLTGINDVRSADSAEAQIKRLVLRSGSAAGRGGLFVERGKESAADPFQRSLVLDSDARIASLDREIAALRLVKDAEELRRLRKAIDLTTEAERRAMRMARPGVWEYELEATIESTFRSGGAERVGFPSIVGSGPNSTTLHYDKNRRQTQPGDLVVSDIGAEYGYYSGDVTRTFPVSGRFTDRQRKIYELVLATQQNAIDSVRPGMTVGRLNAIARTYMREHSGSLCAPVTCDRYYPHGLSHWLGMDVHDVGNYATPFEPGMVLTVEPGIYLAKEGLGVRIEDDVLVTPSGHEVLSAAAPRTPDEVEAAMRPATGHTR